MGRRTVLLVVAVVIAALGTGMIFAYVNNADDRALADQAPKKVLVATQLIGAGTTGSQAQQAGALELREIASAAVPQGALSDITPVSELVALSPIFPGEQILAAKFGKSAATSGLVIPTGKLAVSVQLEDPARVAGFVQPGSEVAVFVSLSGPQPGVANAAEATRVLLPRVGVIAVGPTTVARGTAKKASTSDTSGTVNTEAVPRAILTLAVSQLEAQRLIYAAQQGELYFGLLNKDSKVDRGPAITVNNLFS